MSAQTIVCNGVDGGDPLGLLAGLGLLVVGERAGRIDRMWWEWRGGWRPVYRSSGGEAALVDAVLEFMAGREAAAARSELEAAEHELRECQAQLPDAKRAVESATDRTAKQEARAVHAELVARNKALKEQRSSKRLEVQELASKGVAERHPITISAQHLDDATKGGLSAEQFASLARHPDAACYLSGIACDLELPGKKKVIARTHLSFANNNSGKQLLKDFATLACLATESRVRDALFGDGVLHDRTTGLGWDPASQRSYALQFTDPQDEVTCQAMHHALAFVGLACLTVMPTGAGRTTLGVYRIAGDSSASAVEDEGDEGDEADEDQPARGRKSRPPEFLTWPIWSEPLSADAVRSLLAWKGLAEATPSTEACHALGIMAVMRSRRFALSKRSYLSPARPVA